MTLKTVLESVFLYRVTESLLSAASLLSATVGVLYSVWYGEISDALSLKKEEERDNRSPAIKKVQAAIESRSRPLWIASILLALTMLPPTASTIVIGFIALFGDWHYDPVATLFFAMYLVALMLMWKIRGHYLELKVKLVDLQNP